MNPFRKARRRRMLAGESGQMAIFIALIFQILFVFFAMVVNIGLVIHDKINLQNAVDLGAYYGAQKQAEMLNEIAHINYQLRQDYKLLSWRARVLGTFGRTNHPQQPGQSADDVVYNDPSGERPGICVAHRAWEETRAISDRENLCMYRPGTTIPEIPPVTVLPLTLPFNNVIKGLVDNLRSGFDTRCQFAGPFNWVFTAQVMYAFREAGSLRKRMIQVLSKNLTDRITPDGESFRDLELQPVYTGIERTIKNNLTVSNLNGFEMEALNGLSQGVCGQIDLGYPSWLREISIDPVLYYTNFRSGGGCDPTVYPMMYVPGTVGPNGSPVPGDPGIVGRFDASRDLRTVATMEPPMGDYRHSSRGFEKNPWCMAYIGVKARSRPRKPFAPFGQPITLEARSFAQPFGGRIGPWDRDGWALGASFSTGSPVDPLAVPRTLPGTGPTRDEAYIPNYSRFPGDTLGMKSRLALAATRSSLYGPATASGPPTLSLNQYSHFGMIDRDGDALAWDIRGNGSAPPVRQAEIAAVAPDLFDATYYSIEPGYFGNYFSRDPVRRFRDFAALSDLGSRTSDPRLRSYSVRDQILQAILGGAVSADAYWMIRDPSHLLTGWTHETATDYSFPSVRFGHCMVAPEDKDPPNPGNCIYGGRTGYSVRLVHRNFLYFQAHALGGEDPSAGPLLNPPPHTF